MDKKSMNHRINMLYRQLGKSLYEDKQGCTSFSKEQKKLIKLIEHMISEVNKTEVDNEVPENKLPEDAKILTPIKNEDGVYLYRFCPKCQVGNNPESTHCSQCFAPF